MYDIRAYRQTVGIIKHRGSVLRWRDRQDLAELKKTKLCTFIALVERVVKVRSGTSSRKSDTPFSSFLTASRSTWIAALLQHPAHATALRFSSSCHLPVSRRPNKQTNKQK